MPADSPVWFYRRTTLIGAEEDVGPVEQREIIELARAGKLNRNTLLCCPTRAPDKWYELAQVPGLLKALEQGERDRAELKAKAQQLRHEQRAEEQQQRAEKQRAIALRTTTEAEQAAAISEGQDPALVLTIAERVRGILVSSEAVRFIVIQQRPVVNIAPDAAVITNRRLILYRPKLLGRFSFEDYLLFDLKDAHLEQGFLASIFTARHTSGRFIRIDWLPKGPAMRLYRLAQELEEQARMARLQLDIDMRRAGASQINICSMPAPPTAVEATVIDGTAKPAGADPTQRLRKLKEMLDAGLISQPEFEQRKQQILAEI